MFMRDGCEFFQVDHIELGIAERFGIDGASAIIDGFAETVVVVGFDEANFDAELGQRVVEQIVGAAIERCGGDNFVAGIRQREDGEGFRRLAGGCRQRRNSAFQCGHALFKNIVSRVHDAAVDIAELLQAEQGGGVIGIFKHVGSRLVDGHGARSRRGIDSLAGVNGESSGSMLIRFRHSISPKTALIL